MSLKKLNFQSKDIKLVQVSMYIVMFLFNNLKYKNLIGSFIFSHVIMLYLSSCPLFLHEALKSTNENVKFIIYFHVIFQVKTFVIVFSHIGNVIIHITQRNSIH
jgi:hypothetical protein